MKNAQDVMELVLEKFGMRTAIALSGAVAWAKETWDEKATKQYGTLAKDFVETVEWARKKD